MTITLPAINWFIRFKFIIKIYKYIFNLRPRLSLFMSYSVRYRLHNLRLVVSWQNFYYLNTMVANVGSWCPTLCYHDCISAMWGLVTWWPSCKLCMGSLVSLYGLSETFINTRNFVYLLQSSDVYTQLNNCLL